MEKSAIRDVASCDLDLHQVNKPIAARDRDASHARREVKLHRRLCGFRVIKTLEPQLPKATNTRKKPTIRSAVATPNALFP